MNTKVVSVAGHSYVGRWCDRSRAKQVCLPVGTRPTDESAEQLVEDVLRCVGLAAGPAEAAASAHRGSG